MVRPGPIRLIRFSKASRGPSLIRDRSSLCTFVWLFLPPPSRHQSPHQPYSSIRYRGPDHRLSDHEESPHHKNNVNYFFNMTMCLALSDNHHRELELCLSTFLYPSKCLSVTSHACVKQLLDATSFLSISLLTAVVNISSVLRCKRVWSGHVCTLARNLQIVSLAVVSAYRLTNLDSRSTGDVEAATVDLSQNLAASSLRKNRSIWDTSKEASVFETHFLVVKWQTRSSDSWKLRSLIAAPNCYSWEKTKVPSAQMLEVARAPKNLQKLAHFWEHSRWAIPTGLYQNC